MAQSINDIQNDIIDEFALFDDPMDQYEYIIDLGKKLKPMDDSLYTEDNLVKGCQSKVWLHAEDVDGKVIFHADSNTVITKGIVGLLVRILSNHTAEEIANADLFFIDKIKLRSHLSSQRSNGLNAMIQKMKTYALGLNTAKA